MHLFHTGKPRNGLSKYRQLEQQSDLSDEEENVYDKQESQLELSLIPNIRPHNHRTRRKLVDYHNFKSKCQNLLVIVSIFVVLACIVAIGILAAKLYRQKGEDEQRDSTLSEIITSKTVHHDGIKLTTPGTDSIPQSHTNQRPHNDSTKDWKVFMNNIGGEGGLRLLDIDGDGRDDIIFGAADQDLLGDVMGYDYSEFADIHKFCAEKGHEYPCIGKVIALRGYDGKELWRMNTMSEVFLITCDGIDINKDGKPDCIGGGRMGVIVAFDPYEGKTLWRMEDDKFVNATWNAYQPVAIPDWNNDGVSEIMITNGGDPKKDPEDHNRLSGRLIVLSGATGKPLGNRYLAMPDNRETYMTPVLYTPPDGSQPYVLFGSGGETVPGDLMGISMYDLCHYIMGAGCTMRHQEEEFWDDVIHKDKDGIFIIYKGQKKGVMVPPVIVDVNKDGVNDLVASVYDGAVILFDGRTLQPTWRANFTNMESYSSPAPAYYDDDDTLDFMVHWCRGAWAYYTDSNATILSGKDGSVLWTLESYYMQMTSDLVISTNHKHRDMYVFKLQARQTSFRWDLKGKITRQHKMRFKRHGAPETHDVELKPNQTLEESMYETYKAFNLDCHDDLDTFKGEVFVMDRSMASNPLQVLDIPTKKVYTIDTGEEKSDIKPGSHIVTKDPRPMSHMLEGGHHNAGRRKRHEEKETKICNVALPDVRSTGAIGDVDGDGNLDYISLFTYSTTAHTSTYDYSNMLYSTDIQKISLQTAVADNKLKHVPVAADTVLKQGENPKGEGAETRTQFLPLEHQKWTQYMGRHGDNLYH